MPNVSGAPDETVQVPISIDCDVDFTAFQLFFTVPEDFEIIDVETTDRIENTAQFYDQYNGNQYAAICHQPQSLNAVSLYEPVNANDVVVMTITVKVPSDVSSGQYTMRLYNMQFIPVGTSGGGSTLLPDEVTATLTVTGSGNSNYDFKVDGIYYRITGSNTVAVTCEEFGNAAYGGDVVIPEYVVHGGKAYYVKEIGAAAFYNCTFLESVSIPKTVTKISTSAFWYCENMESITLPPSLTSILPMAFAGCRSLREVTCLATMPPTINETTFEEDTYASATLTVPMGHKDDYQRASYWWHFTHMYQTYSFVENGIYYNLTSSSTVEVTYKDDNFNSYSGSVNIPSNVTHDGYNYLVTGIGDWAFKYCHNLTGVAIPNTVTLIDEYSFDYCDGLTRITIPASVTTIGSGAFRGCGNLTSIKVNSGNPVYDSRNNCNAIIETASNKLIRGCRNTLIPNTVTSIGFLAFENCYGLTSVTIPNSVTAIGDWAFDSCHDLESVYLPSSVTSIDYQVFYRCPVLSSITVESGNPVYDSRNNCNAIIETATNSLIKGCNGTVIPNTVTVIDDYAFAYSCYLTSIVIPNSVTLIGWYAFEDCNRLQTVTIGNSVTSIGWLAFGYCDVLKDVTIGSSVEYMDHYVFTNCHNLSNVTCLAATPPTMESNTFDSSHYPFTEIKVPNSSLNAYKAADYWRNFTYFSGITLGDLNGDSLLDVADVTALINMVLGNTPVNLAVGDINHDGNVDVADVTLLIGHVLNGTVPAQ